MTQETNASRAALLFLVGMLLPVIGSWLFHDVLSVYLSGRAFTYSIAVGFSLLGWVFLTVWDTDRLDFISWAIIVPWVFVLGMVVLVMSADRPSGLTYLFRSMEDLVAFAGSFTLAGFASVVIRERVDRASQRYPRVPSSQSIAIGFVSVLVIAILAGGALLTVSAMSASVSDVEPGVVEYRSSQYAALNVTVEGDPTELLLTVTGPDGGTHTKRIPRTAMEGDSVTVPVESYYLDGYPKTGTYHVKVSTISFITVDTATYSIDSPPSPSLVAVETAGPGEPLPLDLPSNATVPRGSTEPTNETRVAVVIENEGDAGDDFDISLPGDAVVIESRSLFLEPGQQGVRIFTIPHDHVERIHEEENGTVTVEVAHGETRIVEEVPLPGA